MVGEQRRKRKMTPASKLGRKKATPLPQSPIDIDSPIRAIACLKKVDDMKRFEENEDCFILGFDPSDSVMLSCDDDSPTTSSVRSQDVDDLCFVAEKGKIALRDYPHSRHLCLKFPFKTTPHESYCGMCYCYVCDCAAPCKYWTLGRHCNAENVRFWMDLRKTMKKQVH